MNILISRWKKVHFFNKQALTTEPLGHPSFITSSISALVFYYSEQGVLAVYDKTLEKTRTIEIPTVLAIAQQKDLLLVAFKNQNPLVDPNFPYLGVIRLSEPILVLKHLGPIEIEHAKITHLESNFFNTIVLGLDDGSLFALIKKNRTAFTAFADLSLGFTSKFRIVEMIATPQSEIATSKITNLLRVDSSEDIEGTASFFVTTKKRAFYFRDLINDPKLFTDVTINLPNPVFKAGCVTVIESSSVSREVQSGLSIILGHDYNLSIIHLNSPTVPITFRFGSSKIDERNGPKIALVSRHTKYVVVFTVQDLPAKPMLQILDLRTQLQVGEFNFKTKEPPVIASQWGNLYLSSPGLVRETIAYTFSELRRVSYHEMLEVFFKKNLYEAALEMASDNEKDRLAIQVKYADYLFQRKQYKPAMDRYKEAVAELEPSVVIEKYLSVDQLELLEEYLERLSALDRAEPEHITLLLLCYVRLGKDSKVEELISKPTNKAISEKMIEILREENRSYDAAIVAMNNLEFDYALEIALEDLKGMGPLLKFVETLFIAVRIWDSRAVHGFSANSLGNYGPHLLRLDSSVTTKMILDLIQAVSDGTAEQVIQSPYRVKTATFKWNDRVSDEEYAVRFTSLFVPLLTTVDGLREKYWEFLKSASSIVGFSEGRINRAMALEFPEKEESLTRFRGDIATVTYFSSQKEKLLYRNMDEKWKMIYLRTSRQKPEQIGGRTSEYLDWSVVKRRSRASMVQMLEYLYLTKQEDQIPNYLSISGPREGIPDTQALILLDALKRTGNGNKGSGIQIRLVREYLVNFFRNAELRLTNYKEEKSKLQEKLTKKRQELEELKSMSMSFGSEKCDACDGLLDHPSVFFMCGHIFHKTCLSEGNVCPECAMKIRRKTAERRVDVKAYEAKDQFFTRLEDPGQFMDTVLEGFGKSWFVDFKADESSEDDDDEGPSRFDD